MVLFDNLYIEALAERFRRFAHELDEEVYPEREIRRSENRYLLRAFTDIFKLFRGVARRRKHCGHAVFFRPFKLVAQDGGGGEVDYHVNLFLNERKPSVNGHFAVLGRVQIHAADRVYLSVALGKG